MAWLEHENKLYNLQKYIKIYQSEDEKIICLDNEKFCELLRYKNQEERDRMFRIIIGNLNKI
jgi:hypothetical protein